MKSIDRFDSLIKYWQEKYGLPSFDRLKAQMLAESGANAKALSVSGAIGLFQLMPATAVELGVDPNDLDENIKGGCAYMEEKLRQVRTTLGSVAAAEDEVYRMALAAYNCGFGYVKLAIQDLRKHMVKIEWYAFLEALKNARFGPNQKRADWKQVNGYVHKILPPMAV